MGIKETISFWSTLHTINGVEGSFVTGMIPPRRLAVNGHETAFIVFKFAVYEYKTHKINDEMKL